jgi:hypothetical protein
LRDAHLRIILAANSPSHRATVREVPYWTRHCQCPTVGLSQVDMRVFGRRLRPGSVPQRVVGGCLARQSHAYPKQRPAPGIAWPVRKKNTEGTKTLSVSFQSQMPNLGQQPALRQHRHPAKGARSSAQEPGKAPVEVKDYAATRVLLAVRGRRCNRGCFSTQSSPCVPAPARVLDREETGVDPVVRDCPSWGPRAINEYTP